jgi:hypothetical protein
VEAVVRVIALTALGWYALGAALALLLASSAAWAVEKVSRGGRKEAFSQSMRIVADLDDMLRDQLDVRAKNGVVSVHRMPAVERLRFVPKGFEGRVQSIDQMVMLFWEPQLPKEEEELRQLAGKLLSDEDITELIALQLDRVPVRHSSDNLAVREALSAVMDHGGELLRFAQVPFQPTLGEEER